MNLQDSLIEKLNTTYPDITLKEISKRTGIQLTRVFRILNGYEMKVSEYERLESLVREKTNTSSHNEHINLYLKFLNLQSLEQQQRLEQKYNKIIELNSFLLPFSYLNENGFLNQGEINA
jgi:predicted transcriptional regulator